MKNAIAFLNPVSAKQTKCLRAINTGLERLPTEKRQLFDRLVVSWSAAKAKDPFACVENVLKYVQEQP